MTENSNNESSKKVRLKQVATELNISVPSVLEFLGKKGFEVDNNPNAKLSADMYDALQSEFSQDRKIKEQSAKITIGTVKPKEVQPEVKVEKPVPVVDEPVPVAKVEVVAEPIIETPAPVEDVVEEKAPESVPVVEETPIATVKPPAPIEEKVEAPLIVETPVAPVAQPVAEEEKGSSFKVLGKINLDDFNRPKKKKEAPKPAETTKSAQKPTVAATPDTPKAETKDRVIAKKDDVIPAVEEETIRGKADALKGITVVGKIDLQQFEKKKPVPGANKAAEDAKKKRKRKEKTNVPVDHLEKRNVGATPGQNPNWNKSNAGNNKNTTPNKSEPSVKEIGDQIKATMARMAGTGTKFSGRAKIRKQKRENYAEQQRQIEADDRENNVLKATEFLTTADLASLMNATVTDVISKCFSLGIMVSINQRLDAETIMFVADEFGFEVEFINPDSEDAPNLEEEDNEVTLNTRAPIVTIMGHVDHGKTSLLDFIRSTNVIAGEAGGITQHIGAYEVTLENGKQITFLDTPGHEAFTAMRARGAKVTDIVVIVVAADDSVMPQTKEAISHAQAAGVPLIFAINKIDKDGSDPERIKGQLAEMNLLVEDWGGKYQSQEISAKKGLNIDLLLEKILLEAEILDLKADPEKRAMGTVIEARLDKGKGVVTTMLVQKGTLRVGDNILAGQFNGRVKALMNERGARIEQAGPSQPAQILGFNNAPQAGDTFYITESETQAKEIATKRQQIMREQGMRTKKHITLDEVGRRLAIGDFKELNIIVKGDVDGSVEALSDSLQKLSSQKVQVNIIHRGVGQISESDVMLASASNAIIVGFQVRAYPQARKLAENEEIDIRYYSIIYDAIEEVKSAIEGLLAPTIEEKITSNVEIREVYKISKVGAIAGCYVLDGKINRNHKIRLIRDGVVIYTGSLGSLKRFKDDVKEVATGYECGLSIENYNDIKVGDIVEGFERVEIKAKL